MAKKKVTEEEVENGTKKTKVEKIVPKMKKITPKRVKVPQVEEKKVEKPEETVEEPEETEETEEAVEEAEEVIDTSNMKVTIFTSRRKVMRNGAPIILTSKLDGFEGIEQINYQWYCDKGNGFEPMDGANSDSYTYTANSETLSWSWLLEVSF